MIKKKKRDGEFEFLTNKLTTNIDLSIKGLFYI